LELTPQPLGELSQLAPRCTRAALRAVVAENDEGFSDDQTYRDRAG
jgi:hypothetical protein